MRSTVNECRQFIFKGYIVVMSLKEHLTPEKINKAFEKTLHEVTFKTGNLVIITEDLYDKVFAFCKDVMYPDNPIFQGFGVEFNDTIKRYDKFFLDQGISLALIDPDNGDIMGFRGMGLVDDTFAFTSDDEEDAPLKAGIKFSDYCERRANFLEYYKTQECVQLFGLGVSHQYRKQGIGTKLMEAALRLLENLRVSSVYVKGISVSNFAIKIFDKFGFEVLDEVKFADYTVDGKQVIRDTGEHTCWRMYGIVI